MITTRANGFSEIIQAPCPWLNNRCSTKHATDLRRAAVLGQCGTTVQPRRASIVELAAGFDISVNVRRTSLVLRHVPRADSVSGKNSEDLIEPGDFEDRTHASPANLRGQTFRHTGSTFCIASINDCQPRAVDVADLRKIDDHVRRLFRNQIGQRRANLRATWRSISPSNGNIPAFISGIASNHPTPGSNVNAAALKLTSPVDREPRPLWKNPGR